MNGNGIEVEESTKTASSLEVSEAGKIYPSLTEFPKRVREILILTAIGNTQDMIAKRLGCTQSAISQTITRYDPDGIYKPSMDLRKEVIKASLGTVALEAVRCLTGMTDKFGEYTPKTLIDIITKLESIHESMGSRSNNVDKGVESSLAELAR